MILTYYFVLLCIRFALIISLLHTSSYPMDVVKSYHYIRGWASAYIWVLNFKLNIPKQIFFSTSTEEGEWAILRSDTTKDCSAWHFMEELYAYMPSRGLLMSDDDDDKPCRYEVWVHNDDYFRLSNHNINWNIYILQMYI